MNNTRAANIGQALIRVENALTAYGSIRKGSHSWQCPVSANHTHGDRKPSLSVSQKEKGEPGVRLKCHTGCETKDIVAALGLTLRDLFDQPYEHGSDSIRDTLRTLRQQAESIKWPGRRANSKQRIYIAILDRGIRIGSFDVTFAKRDASLSAGIGDRAASGALRELRLKDNLLKVVARSEQGSYVYRIVCKNAPVGTCTTLFNDHVHNWGTLAHNDQAEKRSRLLSGELSAWLGSALNTYLNLSANPLTDAKLADRVGKSRTTVNRHLRFKLAPNGLAVKIGDGWIIGPADSGSFDPGTGIVKKRAARYEKERADDKGICSLCGKPEPCRGVCVMCGVVTEHCDWPLCGKDCITAYRAKGKVEL